MAKSSLISGAHRGCDLFHLHVEARLLAGQRGNRIVVRERRGNDAFIARFGGTVLLALLGALLPDELQRLNALKGLLSLLVAVVSAVGFALFGPIAWDAALIVGCACLAGGVAGVRVARRLSAPLLRGVVVVFGVAVAITLLV